MVGQHEPLAGREVVVLLDPVKHLAGGLLSEGQEQNPFGRHALLAKPPVALDQHPGLSGAGPGDDEQGPLRMGDGRPLGVAEDGLCRRHRVGPAWRKRISRTAGAPIRSLRRSIRPRRSRWS